MVPLLIDLDGVLRIGDRPAKYLNSFLKFIEKRGITACIISNSTVSDSRKVRSFFHQNNLECRLPIMTAVEATYEYIKSNYKTAMVYCSDETMYLFDEFIDEKTPEVVAVGDLGDKWNFKVMNTIFNYVMNGSDFIAMQKNKFWKKSGDELLLDAGAFVTAIEYASGKTAKLVGKPSPIYFKMGLKKLGCDNNAKFIMLGDDLETDIKGANEIGATSILIFTGKTTHDRANSSSIKPDFNAEDLNEAMSILERIYSY